MFQTLLSILSGLWFVLRNTPIALRHLPLLVRFFQKVVAAFGSEVFQEAIQAFCNLIDRVAPPTPQNRSAGTPVGNTGADTPQRRFFQRFRNRLRVACAMTDKEAQEYCDLIDKDKGDRRPNK